MHCLAQGHYTVINTALVIDQTFESFFFKKNCSATIRQNKHSFKKTGDRCTHKEITCPTLVVIMASDIRSKKNLLKQIFHKEAYDNLETYPRIKLQQLKNKETGADLHNVATFFVLCSVCTDEIDFEML